MAQQAQSRAKRAATSTAKRTSARSEASSRVRSRNETPNTPDIEESRLARLRVDELRQMARTQNIAGAATMRKGDLVRAVARQSCGSTVGKQGKKSTRSSR